MTGKQEEIPIQPVDKPILCSPYREPDQHWRYDRSTGIPHKEPGRRKASYWYKNERTGAALPTDGRFRFVASDRTGRPWITLIALRGVH